MQHPPGTPVAVHANLTRRCLTVRPKGGRVEQHRSGYITLTGAQFKCSTPGHHRIVSTGNREVIARIHGTVANWVPVDVDIFENNPDYIPVSYNPVTYPDRPYFYTPDGTPVDKVDTAYVITSDTIPTKARTRAYIRRVH